MHNIDITRHSIESKSVFVGLVFHRNKLTRERVMASFVTSKSSMQMTSLAVWPDRENFESSWWQFSYKRSPNIWWLLGQFKKITSLVNLQRLFTSNLQKASEMSAVKINLSSVKNLSEIIWRHPSLARGAARPSSNWPGPLGRASIS